MTKTKSKIPRKTPLNSTLYQHPSPISQQQKIEAPPAIRGGKKLFCGKGNTPGSRGGPRGMTFESHIYEPIIFALVLDVEITLGRPPGRQPRLHGIKGYTSVLALD
ncbi:hypothetical protein CEXT_438121 [Caerostris extrusa]|uniref:Uncharacterized protein n=1 Tax=Caerostris extrusa TaxID=172846 RepID=A0AAV4MG39_CAEEX|nr:hypothetical protein CEXT_438121 [Caerostris extrusa]